MPAQRSTRFSDTAALVSSSVASSFTCLYLTTPMSCRQQALWYSQRVGVCPIHTLHDLVHTLQALLAAHGALDGDRIAVYPTVYAALAWCETTLIRAATRSGDGGAPFPHAHLARNMRQAMQCNARQQSVLQTCLEVIHGDKSCKAEQ